MKFSDEIQKLLPFGYLYLVIMGIIKESIFYYQLDINILKYSSLMDILISPIADITSHPALIIILTIIFILLLFLRIYALKHPEKEFIKKFFGLKDGNILQKDELLFKINIVLVKFFFAFILCFFLGYGIGGGGGTSKRINNGKLNYDKYGKKIIFNTGDSQEIFLIDSNSLYYFYVVKGQKIISISPIGAVKSIELKNK